MYKLEYQKIIMPFLIARQYSLEIVKNLSSKKQFSCYKLLLKSVEKNYIYVLK